MDVKFYVNLNVESLEVFSSSDTCRKWLDMLWLFENIQKPCLSHIFNWYKWEVNLVFYDHAIDYTGVLLALDT